MKNKFAVAMVMYAVLAGLAWLVLTDPKLRLVTLALLVMFAFKTWVHHRKSQMEEREQIEVDRQLRAGSSRV